MRVLLLYPRFPTSFWSFEKTIELTGRKARIDTVGRGWEEPAGKSQNENMRVEVQWFTLE